MFEMKDAVKKLVAVIAPNVFLVNEVIAMWGVSPQTQTALTALIAYVEDEVDTPDTPVDAAKKKDKSKWRSGDRGSGAGKGSGNSYSNKLSQRQGKGADNGKWPNTRRSFNNSQANSNQASTVAQVNHIRETAVAEAREQWEREQYDKDRDNQMASMQDQIDSFQTARMISELAGDADGVDRPRTARVMQVSTRSTRADKFREATRTRTRAPMEMERLRRAAKVASISSVCKLSKAPLIDWWCVQQAW